MAEISKMLPHNEMIKMMLKMIISASLSCSVKPSTGSSAVPDDVQFSEQFGAVKFGNNVDVIVKFISSLS